MKLMNSMKGNAIPIGRSIHRVHPIGAGKPAWSGRLPEKSCLHVLPALHGKNQYSLCAPAAEAEKEHAREAECDQHTDLRLWHHHEAEARESGSVFEVSTFTRSQRAEVA